MFVVNGSNATALKIKQKQLRYYHRTLVTIRPLKLKTINTHKQNLIQKELNLKL